MSDWFEVDFLGVETAKSGDAITVRYNVGGVTTIHVVDGGFIDTGAQIIEHLRTHYKTITVDHVVLTHSDQDHANGLRAVLEECEVGRLWMNRPWLHAAELLPSFPTYTSVDALERKLRGEYSGPLALEEIAMARGIPISDAFEGAIIGQFTVLTPSKARYLRLLTESEKTPVTEARQGFFKAAADSVVRAATAVANMLRAAWGEEVFPASDTSSENEMSVVQYAYVNGKRVLLTGDSGREGLTAAANYLESRGVPLPGIWCFQVPHHGGRHNVNTEVLDRWAGPRLPQLPETTTWNAVCSSAKADTHHPKMAVKRAFMHRGAHWAETEGRTVHVGTGIKREGWTSIPQAMYPSEQEDN